MRNQIHNIDRLARSVASRILRIIFGPILNDISAVDAKVGNLAAQVDRLIQADLEADLKVDLHTRLMNEANDKHDTMLNYLKHTYHNQNFSVYAHFGEVLLPEFIHILQRTLGNDFPVIQRNAKQLFTEILIDHLMPGGIWRLQHDIAQFPHATSEVKVLPLITSSPVSSASLKICIVSGCFPSLMHGGGGRLLDIITELSINHQIDLYTHYNPGLDASSLDLIEDKLVHVKLVEDYHLFSVSAVESWFRSINRDVGYYDVIQLEYPQTVRFINPLRKYGKRVGFTFMECLAKSHTEKLDATLSVGDYDTISQQIRDFWMAMANEKYALDNADFCIAVTDEDAKFLQRLSPCPTHIIPTCLSRSVILEEAAKYIDVQSKENEVVFIGFFGHWPNIEAMEWYLSAIHPLIKAQLPGYHLTIVGSGDVTKLIQLSEGDNTVTVTGKVDSIVPYILKAKVCVSPLVSGAGIRGKQNQYAALGRPSVTTSIGNNGLLYRQEESVLIADKPSDFAGAVVRLLTDDKMYAKIQQQAQEIALENYSWPKHLEKMLVLYRGGCGQHGTYLQSYSETENE